MHRIKLIFKDAPRLIRNYVRESRLLAREFMMPVLVANASAGLLLIIIHTLLVPFVLYLTYDRTYQNILLMLFSLPFTGYILSGAILYYRELVRNGQARIKLLFTGYRIYPLVLLFSYIAYGLYRLLLFPAINLPGQELIIQLRLIFTALLFIWLVARLIFAPLFFAEESIGLKESIKKSFFLTSGRTIYTTALVLFFTLLSSVVLWPLLALALNIPPALSVFMYLLFIPTFLWSVGAAALS
ncbi:MAG: hypothetical protein KDK34_00895, partial [Leptospiraceae bacterium]|nr:hypothetical protein [Leptospiraceae bacterium]